MKSKRFVVLCAGVAAFLSVGVAFAAWTASGGGSGYAKARANQPLTTVDVSASASPLLYPGGTGDVIVRFANPNPYDVVVTSIFGTGTITSSTGLCDSQGNGVSFTTTNGSWTIPAGGASTVTLPGAASMAVTSPDSCQNATFTIPVQISGHSAP